MTGYDLKIHYRVIEQYKRKNIDCGYSSHNIYNYYTVRLVEKLMEVKNLIFPEHKHINTY